MHMFIQRQTLASEIYTEFIECRLNGKSLVIKNKKLQVPLESAAVKPFIRCLI